MLKTPLPMMRMSDEHLWKDPVVSFANVGVHHPFRLMWQKDLEVRKATSRDVRSLNA
jgi:hypothetical protein